MRRAPSAYALLLASAGAGLGAQEPQRPEAALTPPAEPQPAAPVLKALRFEGGSGDDQLVARQALALQPGQPLPAHAFAAAIQALKLTDRFKTADGRLEAQDGGVAAVVRLEAWPLLAGWRLEGDPVPKALRKVFLADLHKGIRAGNLRIEALRLRGETQLREGGYPSASVAIRREGDAALAISVQLGAPALVRAVRITGDPGPYTERGLVKAAGVEPGKTLWTAEALRAAQRGLRKRLVKDKRYEGTADPAFDAATGTLGIEIHAGPVVRVKADGASFFAATFLGQKRLPDLLPFTRSERYTPDQLDEGDRRLQRYYASKGYSGTAVTHTVRVLKGTEAAPEEVELTYHVVKGSLFKARSVRIDGNDLAPLSDLAPLAKLPRRSFILAPLVQPDLVKLLEGRFAAYYAQHGFPAASVRVRVLDHPGDPQGKDLLVQIHEGPRSFLAAVEIRVPKQAGLDPAKLAPSLAYALADHPALKPGLPILVTGDRRGTLGIQGRIERLPDAGGMAVLRLSTDKPLPQVNPDLAQVVSDLRARLASAGSPQPRVSLAFEGQEDQPRVAAFQVPPQPLDTVKRVVVRGADATRPEAIFRELPFSEGDPLDPAKLTESQSSLGDLGAFRRADFSSLDETAEGEVKADSPFTRGDLGLDLEERRPWVFTEGFGYDKSQGYHFLLGAQRLNVGGMGRTLDFGIRAGDNTLKNPTLRKWFPTGDVNRSLDDYSVAYTDPWPGFIQRLFKPRIRWRSEAAYIEEATATYFARRRRLTTAFSWKVGDLQTMEAGYRFERTDYGPNRDGISDIELKEIARTNKLRAIISAPYLQLVRDERDRPYDPTQGSYFSARLDFANQLFGTTPDSSFVKLDVRKQWNWSFGYRGERGVLAATLHLGVARPTAATAEELPLSERFYAGGPFSVRGVEPDFLGPVENVPLRDPNGNILYNDPPFNTSPKTTIIPLGGQALAVASLEYRFPLFGDSVWGEIFVDTGQVYSRLKAGPRFVLAPSTSTPPAGYDPGNPQPWDPAVPPPAGYMVQDQGAPFPAFRTTPGLGLIFKLGFPLKIEYAADWRRILGRPRSQTDRDTQLKSLLISAGFQF